MHKEKSAFPQSPGIRARSDYIISAHTAEVNQYTTISQELEHLQGWGLHITQHLYAHSRLGPHLYAPLCPVCIPVPSNSMWTATLVTDALRCWDAPRNPYLVP